MQSEPVQLYNYSLLFFLTFTTCPQNTNSAKQLFGGTPTAVLEEVRSFVP